MESKQGKISTWLVITTLVTTTGSSMLFGYNTGVLNTPAKIIISFYNVTYAARSGSALESSLLNFLWAITVSMFVCTGMAGAFSSGYFADSLGRKKALLFNHTFMFIGALLEGLSKIARIPELLISGRAFIGFNCGMTVGLASLYLVEISPKEVRGAIGSCHQLAVTTGILMAQILGLQEILGTEEGWPILCALSAVTALFSLIFLPLCPESPRYLLHKKGNANEARKALVQLRGTDDVTDEMMEMQAELKETNPSRKRAFKTSQLFKSNEYRKPLMIAIVLQVAQQWSGINAIFFYSEAIFEESGVTREHIPYAIVGTGLINVVTTLFSVNLVEKLGRRGLLLGPMAIMAMATIIITVAFNLKHTDSRMAHVSIACIILFIVGFASGLGSIPQVICSEIFRQEARSAAMGVAQGVNWTCNFILAMGFTFMQETLQDFTFLVFLAVLIICMLFIFFFVPETKNRTFDEIARDVSQGVRRSPKVKLLEDVELVREEEKFVSFPKTTSV